MASYEYLLVNAFTADPFRGNPALTVFLNDNATLSTDDLQGIARNWQQPIVSFLFPVAPNQLDLPSNTVEYGVRWFSTRREVILCGHGTLAACHALLASGRVPSNVDVISFRPSLLEGQVVTAAKIEVDGKTTFEIELPSTILIPLLEDECMKMTGIVQQALGKSDVQLRFAARGVKEFEQYLLLVLDNPEVLKGCAVDTDRFKNTGYKVNVLTSEAPADLRDEALFVSRMFAPVSGIAEDHVCGSAHCLLGPYWSAAKNVKHTRIAAIQVSERGGKLDLVVDEATVKLRGEGVLFARGQMFL